MNSVIRYKTGPNMSSFQVRFQNSPKGHFSSGHHPSSCAWSITVSPSVKKRDDFNFPIVNFPYICIYIPAAPTYELYTAQFIRYSRACGSYYDFLTRWLLLTRKLLNQGFLVVKLNTSLQKFSGLHNHLVNRYKISVSQMMMDMFHLS